jgi:signal transduction histidine kinase
MLLRILANLVSNAVKFSPKGGTVKLSAKINEGSVTVTVEDQGAGLPQDMLESVFDRFQQAPNQTARTRGGSGLGLAICKALVDCMAEESGPNLSLTRVLVFALSCHLRVECFFPC